MPMFKVTNLGCPEDLKGERNRNDTPYEELYDPLNLVIGGTEFPLYPGDPLLQTESIVKHWFGNWDIKDGELYDKEMDRVEKLHGHVPQVEIERIVTKSEKEAQQDKERETKYKRPDIKEAVLGEGGTYSQGVTEEIAAQAGEPVMGIEFSQEDIEEAEEAAKRRRR